MARPRAMTPNANVRLRGTTDLSFLSAPTGLAVGLARKESRYAARWRRFAPGRWLRPVVPPFPAGVAARRFGVSYPQFEVGHLTTVHGGPRKLATLPRRCLGIS